MSAEGVRTPREVAEEWVRLRREWNTEETLKALVELYADDVVIDVPFAKPRGRVEGRARLEEMTRGTVGRLRARLTDAVLHTAADDPEVVVVEFGTQGEVPATGRSFDTRNVVVMRVRDGRIAESHDYHDHVALGEAMGAGADH
ncbi:nuclear transport factor 2 family protein [Phaeacidiphilus oryzae]|uniref:nuclear transport factor 2 family protein n=1 Tax=Phaeacidiphilus oryzae TaxID=348818 RepID=UPI000691EC30|nr:nuclear transport factor 2 family protein [Phaeacidiphilus oryzae]